MASCGNDSLTRPEKAVHARLRRVQVVLLALLLMRRRNSASGQQSDDSSWVCYFTVINTFITKVYTCLVWRKSSTFISQQDSIIFIFTERSGRAERNPEWSLQMTLALSREAESSGFIVLSPEGNSSFALDSPYELCELEEEMQPTKPQFPHP